LGAHFRAITPDHFISSLSALAAENEFMRDFELVSADDLHAAIKLKREAIVSSRARLALDDAYVTKGPTQRTILIFECLPDHGVTKRVVKHPLAPKVA
jgi:hypothetical protein